MYIDDVTRESLLQKELRQTKPFQSPRQEAALSILKTADVVRRTLSRAIEPHGITLQQYNVLRILRGAGLEGLPTLEIPERMIEQAPGITRLIDRLERKRLVSRERCPEDRRQVTCRISESGLDLLAKMDVSLDHADDALFAALSTAEQRQLIKLLDRVRADVDLPA